MFQRLLAALILAAPLASPGAGLDPAAGLSIGSLEATHSSGTEYRFPRIGGESLAAARINTFLQTLELQKLPGRYDESPFEDIWPDADSQNGVTSIDYTLAFDQPGILSVVISSQYYGAYDSSNRGTYYFDARTGEVITLRSLFTSEGLARIDAEITAKRLQRVDDFLAGKKLDSDTQLRTDPNEAAEQKELYANCRTFIETGHPVEDDELTLDRDTFRLLREPCGPRMLAAVDELGFHDTRDYEQPGVEELLNDYGRCLLIARRTNCQRSYTGIRAGVYRGKIGERHPITLVVEKADSDGDVRATYYYDKYAEAIPLKGAATADGGVRLDEGGAPPARFELRMQPDGLLQGSWTQEGKAPQNVELR